MIVSLVFYLVLFLFVLLFAVYVPGAVAVSFIKQKISALERLALALSLGIVIFTLLGFFLGFLGLRFLIIPVILVFNFCFFKNKLYKDLKRRPKLEKSVALVIVVGAITQVALMLKSGLPFADGLAFWGVHGYDGIWHSALISELARNFPPQNPGFAGEALKNYHFLTDLFMAQIHQFSKVPILDLYFRFCPLFFTLLLNLLVYLFALRWSKKKEVGLLSVFFVSLAGSFGWILPFFGLGSNNWETAFWGIQTPSSFVNPPFGVSLVVILSFFVLLDLYRQKKEKILGLLLVISVGSLVGFKVYGAAVFLLSLGLLGLWELLRRKDVSFLILFFLAGLLSLAIYLPFSRGSTGFLVFKPWWFIRTMIRAPDRVNWQRLELRWQTYEAYSDIFSLAIIGGVSFLIFLFGNLSARSVGFLVLPKMIKRGSVLDKLLLVSLPISFFPPIFFIQKAVPWNTIQFLYYFTFIFSFLAAWASFKILSFLKHKFLKVAFILILIGICLPSTIETLYWFNAPVPTTLLAAEEVEALSFLRKKSKKEDILLTYPYGELAIRHFPEPPVPMTYYNSPYVSFFTGRRVYLEDQNAATILDYPLEERLAREQEFFQAEGVEKAKEFLVQEKIAYIYLVDAQDIKADKEALGLEKIFENEKVRIFKAGKW